MVQFDPSTGDEIGKRRPAIVLSNERVGFLKLRLMCPITDWKERYSKFPWFSYLEPDPRNGLSKPSGADVFQCKSLSLERFHNLLGVIEAEQFADIIDRLNFCLKRFS